jgi:hypothetical protein
MGKNPVWLALIGIAFAATLWYSSFAVFRLHDYYSLKETTSPYDLKWFVEELESEDFRVGATYSYTLNNANYRGETIFNDHSFRNPSSADDELQIKRAKDHSLFYDPQNFHHSSLQKKFPTKECISAGVLFLLFLYFLGLGIYTSKKSYM